MTGATQDNRVFVPVVRDQRLSDKVADQLLALVLSGQLLPGSRLPSERKLGDQFGVSRTAIREAVRSLAAKGVIEVRAGSGVHVMAVPASQVSEQMNLFLLGRRPLDYIKIHEVRTTLELRTVQLAAVRATDIEISDMHERCDRMAGASSDLEKASIEDVEFHRSIARATHNELFLVLLDSIGDVLLAIRRATLSIPGRVQEGVDFHRRILDGIEAHDPARAAAMMREHLEEACVAWQQLDAGKREAV